MNKVKVFLSLDMKTMLLFIEAYFYLGWARILLFFPFAKVVPSLGNQMEETTEARVPTNTTTLRKVHDVIQIMSRHTFWESKCLVKAIAALKMLEKRKIESTLYLGTGRDESGKMVAHAWLRSGPYYITGADGMERYVVVGKFAKFISG